MKSLKYIITLLSITLLISSCEKVIDVDLKDAEAELVIEAVLQEGKNEFVVSISKTAPYFDNTQSEIIDDAMVTLKIGNETIVDIPSIGNGHYANTITATTDTEYQLEVELDGLIYTANSYLPEVVLIDSVYAVFEEGFGPRESGYTVYVKYTDPAVVSNYYRLQHSLNGAYQNKAEDLQVMNDNRNDGNQVRIPLMMKTFQKGDLVKIELIHFDEGSYDYFNSLGDIIGSGRGPNSGSAAPGNPISNWTNGALGYFSSISSDTSSLVIGN